MDPLELYRRSLNEFTARATQVSSDLWSAPTPCTDWSVYDLISHVVSEDRWTARLIAGATIEEVGDELDGDLVGSDPAGAAMAAAAATDLAMSEPGALDRTVRLSAGPTPAVEYLRQLMTEHLVHAWDLAVAIRADPRLDAEVVHEASCWFVDRMRLYQEGNLIRPGIDVPAGAGEQDRLIASFGRDPGWRPPRAAAP
ncbi:TIGR03086 family metal-binding protein, partial [Micromonospora zhanjiangensis]